MSIDRWRCIEEICHEPLEHDVSRRASFVTDAAAATPRCALTWNRS
jgi:hypothetical protein